MRNYNVSQEHMYNVDNCIACNQIARLHIKKHSLRDYLSNTRDTMINKVQADIDMILNFLYSDNETIEADKIVIQLCINMNLYEFITFK